MQIKERWIWKITNSKQRSDKRERQRKREQNKNTTRKREKDAWENENDFFLSERKLYMENVNKLKTKIRKKERYG